MAEKRSAWAEVSGVLQRVLVIVGGACGLLGLFGVDAFGLGPAKLVGLGVVLLAAAMLI